MDCPYPAFPFRSPEMTPPVQPVFPRANSPQGVVWESLLGLEQLWFSGHATHLLPLVGLT
jgi:hypothetical protein